MNDFSHFPEASEREVLIQGHLLPASAVMVVQVGWVVGALYSLLLLAGLVGAIQNGASPITIALGSLELTVVVGLVVGVFRWRFVPALVLCLHPLISIAFYGADLPGLPLLGGEFGPLQGSATLIVLGLVGRAAKQIRAFRHAIRATA